MEQPVINSRSEHLAKDGEVQRLEGLLKSMTETVAAQKLFIEKHTAAMEKLTQAIKQLDQTLKKEINLESRQASNQLEELVKLFVEYEINPEFYHEYKMLQAAAAPKTTQLVPHKPARKPRREYR